MKRKLMNKVLMLISQFQKDIHLKVVKLLINQIDLDINNYFLKSLKKHY